MPVKQCVCRNLNFDSLLKLARSESMTFEELRQRTHCTEGCGMCEAYIRVMLQTGQTSFKVMNRLSVLRVLSRAAQGDRCDQHGDVPAHASSWRAMSAATSHGTPRD